MKYKIREVTPEDLRCGIGACPSIYKVREVTPESEKCGVGPCPGIYRAEKVGEESYLIIGKKVNPSEAGLEEKVAEDEVLIKVPIRLIDDMGR
ncbi:MAG: hypothetical protein ABIF88_01160 [archaeon]